MRGRAKHGTFGCLASLGCVFVIRPGLQGVRYETLIIIILKETTRVHVMADLKNVRSLRMFNRLNKCIKQGITDLQNKDKDSATNYFNMAIKTATNLEGIADDPFKEHFTNIVSGLNQFQQSKDEDILISTKPESVHSQLWAVHKKICDAYDIPYLEDIDDMEAAIAKLAEEGTIS